MPPGGLFNEHRLATGLVAGKMGHNAALVAQRAGGINSGLRGLLRGKSVLLVGEGDFGFSLALSRLGLGISGPMRLFATGLQDVAELKKLFLDTTEATWRSPALNLWLGGSGPPVGVSLAHGIDATKVGQSVQLQQLLESRDDVIVGWQFPCNGVADDAVGNGKMIADFFKSLAQACYQGLETVPPPSLRIFLTVQSDQVARWGLLRSAREMMFYLEDLLVFDMEELGNDGYVPMCTVNPLKPLELKRPVTFVFRTCCLVSAVESISTAEIGTALNAEAIDYTMYDDDDEDL